MTGDQNDIVGRLKSAFPARWFGDSTPIRDALLQGWASVHAFVYSLYLYAKQQTRIKTASDGWLDLIAADFFGGLVTRSAHQSDASFLARILVNLFRERATRASVILLLKELTGRTPKVFEPQRPMDTGAYGISTSGYGLAGGYGSLLLPYQAFVTAYRPASTGIPYVAGYSISTGGYSTASQAKYVTLSESTSGVSDADIYAAVDSLKVAGTILWTQINA